MAEKKKYPIYTSPKGVAKFANLNVPQTSMKVDGVVKAVDPNYSVTILVDPKDPAIIAFVADIQKQHDAASAEAEAELNTAKKTDAKKRKIIFSDKGIGNMISEDTTKEGEPTGKLAIKFKHKAEGTRKDKSVWTYKPALFDAAGKPLGSGVVVYGGSVIKVAYGIKHTPMPAGEFYTSLQLQAVQVFDLKSEYTKEASAYGFSSEEGYTGEGEENEFGEQAGKAPSDEAADAAQSKDF